MKPVRPCIRYMLICSIVDTLLQALHRFANHPGLVRTPRISHTMLDDHFEANEEINLERILPYCVPCLTFYWISCVPKDGNQTAPRPYVCCKF